MINKYFFFILLLSAMSALNAQTIDFPDSQLKAKLLAMTSTPPNQRAWDAEGNPITVDANGDSEIQVSEAQAVHKLLLNSTTISNMQGIEYFTNIQELLIGSTQLTTLNLTSLVNLEKLTCAAPLASFNVEGLANLKELTIDDFVFTTINLNGLASLERLHCDAGLLTSLDVTGVPTLKYLNCNENNITDLQVEGMPNLEELYCGWNDLTLLDLSGLVQLKELTVKGNQLVTLDLSGLNNLERVLADNNELTSVDLSGTTSLQWFRCLNNNLTTLDASDCINLTWLDLASNNLESIFVKNGRVQTQFYINNNPNISYICADPEEYDYFSQQITGSNLTNVVMNSYCSFTPGGVFNTITGNTTMGCAPGALAIPSLEYAVTGGANYSFTANTEGTYNAYLYNGTYTIAPVLENPSYFNISPAFAQVDFPADGTSVTQNFCITPVGTYNDVEVILLPVTVARPGFDAVYKITYKNKGNTTVSGTVSLIYDDSTLDFITAVPNPESADQNGLVWNFANLAPFELGEIFVTINLNSPLETPALLAGDVLNYTAQINLSVTDETPDNNIFNFNQTVVNSFDPNNKICLEGNCCKSGICG
jgi:hypothetical protein